MKLHHRMLRHFIAASVIVLTSSFLIFELVASDRAMSAYLRYIVQKADSSFLYDKYQNQSIAAHVMRALAAEQSEVSPEQRRAICEAFESANNTHGLNLTAHKYPGLRGTLQTASTDCDTIVEAAALLPAFDQAVEGNRHQDDYGSGLGMAEEKFHYYLDLNDRYVYFYEPVNVEYFAMNNWSFLQSGSIGIDRKDIEKVFTGRTVLSSIYQDQRTKQNVMSLLTPVYVAGQLKGIVLLDINKNNLRNIFYTHDRPLLWRFLNVTLTDTDSGRDIIINQSEDNLFQYVSYVHDLPGGIRVSLSIDILYFITSSWKSVLFWILTALILLNMVRMHFRLYQNVSRENISDAMTGLYNRKILTPELEQRLQKLVQSGSSVMFIAIDMDKLKQINDTLGHQEGDLAITLLAQAIKQSIRKSDYAIRLGGDEFVEMFKAPIKVLHPLLTATQEGNYNGTEGISALPFNGIILAHSNESEWVTFRNNKNNEAFLDRVYIVKVPYCLRISEEIKIYEKLLNHSELTHAPCAPGTLETLSRFSILSRLKEPENSSIYSKMRVYDGESLKDTDPKAKSYQEYRDYAGVDEGMNGLSTRFAFKILSRVFNFDHVEVAANPVHLFYVLEQQIEREQFPQEQAERYLEFLKGYLIPKYAEFIGKEIQTAYLESYSEYGQNIFDRYVTYADFWIQDQEYRDPDTGQLFDRESLNAELEKIEKPAGISNPKDFRNEIVNFVLRARANNSGRNPNWTSYEKLRTVIEKKMFSNTEELLPVISFNAKTSTDEQKKHDDFVDRMMEKGYTRKQVRLLCEWYLRVRKSS